MGAPPSVVKNLLRVSSVSYFKGRDSRKESAPPSMDAWRTVSGVMVSMSPRPIVSRAFRGVKL